MPESDIFAVIAALAEFLNNRNGEGAAEKGMQMLKLSEEAGEVAVELMAAVGKTSAAWIGFTGQNPRKGVTHDIDDVYAELADVAITALVGIARLGGDPRAELSRKTGVMAARYAEVSRG